MTLLITKKKTMYQKN